MPDKRLARAIKFAIAKKQSQIDRITAIAETQTARLEAEVKRREAAEVALKASVGLYRGEVGVEEMQAKMDAWQHIKEEA